MGFEDALRKHLQSLARGPLPPRPQVRHEIDVVAARKHFLSRLRARQDEQPDWAAQAHAKWSPRLEDLVLYTSGLDHAGSLDGEDIACRVLDAALGCLDPSTPLVDRLELERLAESFEHDHEVQAYALETRLTRSERRDGIGLTSLGRVFLRLRGQDAIRWLLEVETSQSQGRHDDWRAGRELLEQALRGGIHFRMEEESPAPFSIKSLDRLSALGVLHVYHDDPRAGAHAHCDVQGSMRAVVRELLEANPWSTAVTALLEDERSFVLPPRAPSAVAATIEQTRMIAHEVRNALIPVRYNIDELLAEDEESEQYRRTRVEIAKQGVVRVLEFVDQLVATSELITEASTTVEVGNLLREAVDWVDEAQGVTLDLPKGSLLVRAPRPLLLRALLGVIRNAIHSATPSPPVRISAQRHAHEVHIVVDDGGPGVPLDLRTRVFDDGFTTRPGGSGFGLAFLRRIVERELHGKVSCEEAELGGARFTIRIPESEANP